LFSVYPVAVQLLSSYSMALLPLYYQQTWRMSYPLAVMPEYLISPQIAPLDYFVQFRSFCHVCVASHYSTPIVAEFATILNGAGEIGQKLDQMTSNVDVVTETVNQVV
jgi:hypothetical protein